MSTNLVKKYTYIQAMTLILNGNTSLKTWLLFRATFGGMFFVRLYSNVIFLTKMFPAVLLT